MNAWKTPGNPYLPSWEYIPDGEPHLFEGRVYLYGSHDKFNGHVFCLNDYLCWSAPADDLTTWTCEGTIYKKTDDPLNPDGRMCLYAPDVTRGADGRYYLYYALDKVSRISVAVADGPAGPFAFYGYVRHADGTPLGEKKGDEHQYDPAVLTEGEHTWLYTGFCPPGDTSRSGCMFSAIGKDMITLEQGPEFILPAQHLAKGTGFEQHEFLEAPSIRKIGQLYYLVYSSTVMHELCYATSTHPDRDFMYRGVIVSNNDLHIDTYKNAQMPAYYGGNNHGGILVNGTDTWIFYHRQTNGTTFSRQGCIEKISIDQDGGIEQVEITSQGPRGKPVEGRGSIPAYIACNLFCAIPSIYTAQAPWPDNRFPLITQDGKDGDEEAGYIANMVDRSVAGFKYIETRAIRSIAITTRGYARGEFLLSLSINGPALVRIPVDYTNIWTRNTVQASIPDGIHALYWTYRGEGRASLLSFELLEQR